MIFDLRKQNCTTYNYVNYNYVTMAVENITKTRKGNNYESMAY